MADSFMSELDGLNATSDSLDLPISGVGRYLSVSVYGVFVGTVTMQRKRRDLADEDANWRAVDSWTEAVEGTHFAVGSWQYRMQMTAYTSGAANVELSI